MVQYLVPGMQRMRWWRAGREQFGELKLSRTVEELAMALCVPSRPCSLADRFRFLRTRIGHAVGHRAQLLDSLLVEVLDADEVVARLLARLDELVELGLERGAVAVLGGLEDRKEQQREDVDGEIRAINERVAATEE